MTREGRIFAHGETVLLLQAGAELQVLGPWYSREFCPRENRLVLTAALEAAGTGELVVDVLASAPVAALLSAAGFERRGECALMVRGALHQAAGGKSRRAGGPGQSRQHGLNRRRAPTKRPPSPEPGAAALAYPDAGQDQKIASSWWLSKISAKASLIRAKACSTLGSKCSGTVRPSPSRMIRQAVG